MPLSPKQKKTIKSLLKDGWTSPRLSFGASGQVYLTPPPNSEAVNARVFKNGSAWVTFPPSGNDRYATVKKFPPPTDQ